MGCGGCGVGRGRGPVGGVGVEESSGQSLGSVGGRPKSSKNEQKSIKNALITGIPTKIHIDCSTYTQNTHKGYQNAANTPVANRGD